MKLSIKSFICKAFICIFSSCFVATIAHSEETISDKSTGLVFPREISFENAGNHYELEITGVATRKKLIIKVYSIASYLQKDTGNHIQDKFQRIMSETTVKQLNMKYTRDVSVPQVQEAYLESFKRVFSQQEYADMQDNISEFLQYFKRGIRKGDEFVLRWLPAGNLEVLVNDKILGNINNEAFVKGVWSIWFGKNSIIDRNDLVSLMN